MTRNLDDSQSDIGFPEQIDAVKMRPYPAAQPRWFYERMDGVVVDVSEEEAFAIEKDPVRSRKLRRFGYSDGKAALEVLRNCGFKPGQMVSNKDSMRIQKESFDAELAVAKGQWRRPRHKAANFDSSILNHENAEGIMRSFGI